MTDNTIPVTSWKSKMRFSNHPKAASAVMVGSFGSLIIWMMTANGIEVSAQHAADIQAILMGLAAFLTPNGDNQS